MKKIVVGMGTCGLSAGAQAAYDRLLVLATANPDVCMLTRTGCIGMCYREPLVEVREGDSRVFYGGVTPESAEEIFSKHILGNEVIDDDNLVYACWPDGSTCGSESDFLDLQERIVLRNCGTIDPESIEDYENAGGYQGVRKALTEMTPSEIIQTIKDSGLRGRGGAGFPTGLKWSFAAANEGDQKYVVCNADEGDPGAFMDRSVLEGDPHAILEGMIICARAIGATFGYIYCRAEYPLAIHRLEIAIAEARQRGYLGTNIIGSGFDFDLKIKQGAGAFVCGEETALFASIEGERGMPRIRPPFPAEKGLWQKPTNNNNVETFANVPWIICNGAEAYTAFGTEKSPGTKVFALAGKVVHGGLAEVPMGTTIEDLVFKIGGGIKEGKEFKAVQMGGPSGGCIPASMKDTPVDFESIPATGAIMGSGGMIAMDENTCMVDVARYFLDFLKEESCVQCNPCREGIKQSLDILTAICEGNGKQGDIELLEELGSMIQKFSLCGLGTAAPNPVLTTIKYFREEYESHIIDKKCPAGVCKNLFVYGIDENACTGCGLCAKKCPQDAITGDKKEPHILEQDKCIKCGICYDACKFNAIVIK